MKFRKLGIVAGNSLVARSLVRDHFSRPVNFQHWLNLKLPGRGIPPVQWDVPLTTSSCACRRTFLGTSARSSGSWRETIVYFGAPNCNCYCKNWLPRVPLWLFSSPLDATHQSFFLRAKRGRMSQILHLSNIMRPGGCLPDMRICLQNMDVDPQKHN